MRAIDLSNAMWRKSSYSNSDGGNCVEVSDDFLSAADWHKSSYSNSDGGQCVEVAHNLPSAVPVRDSKDPARGALVFEAATWARFIDDVKSGAPRAEA
ncbi:DUF397 domain-containing protein [Streptomyces colonosanans]|uniref:DUF397 domain-containing protein n=1 Tax=Streptomyces colonosanans TaxID=1428652 RepID=A0A1S2Q4Z9_9ACTN|nr:DUF397 domain-containing protein [Streptomyces colonosanans]OIK01124.1 DUF397 domain-containing protein [Streptomyces colonosanans]